MLSLADRRAARAQRKLAEKAIDAGQSVAELPSPEAALEAAEASAPYDRFALAGIGKVDARHLQDKA